MAEIIQRRRQFSNTLVSGLDTLATNARYSTTTNNQVTEALDPVCGMTVEIARAHFSSEYNGKIYHFCAAGCKRSFDKEPGKYVQTKTFTE